MPERCFISHILPATARVCMRTAHTESSAHKTIRPNGVIRQREAKPARLLWSLVCSHRRLHLEVPYSHCSIRPHQNAILSRPGILRGRWDSMSLQPVVEVSHPTGAFPELLSTHRILGYGYVPLCSVASSSLARWVCLQYTHQA